MSHQLQAANDMIKAMQEQAASKEDDHMVEERWERLWSRLDNIQVDVSDIKGDIKSIKTEQDNQAKDIKEMKETMATKDYVGMRVYATAFVSITVVIGAITAIVKFF
ncbi:hypothetical protein [Salinithrix halophila]